jgi:hypothetical protein
MGCTTHEIAAITGHATLKEIERYISDPPGLTLPLTRASA